MALDLETLLAPVSDDAPSGESVEYDPLYVELETLARGVAEEKDASGRIVREAEEPDWREVERIALELAARSKDLHVAIYLLRAELALAGLSGFRDGLRLIAEYLSGYWANVHPQLDPDDDNDPSARVNIVASLCHIETILRAVRLAPLTRSRQFGRFNYRQFVIATGLIPPPSTGTEEKLPDHATIEAAFNDTEAGFLADNQAALTEALDALDAIDGAFDEALGAGYGPNLDALRDLLREIKRLIDRQAAARDGGDSGVEDGGGDAGIAISGPSAGGGSGAGGGGGAIRGRPDVILTIDRICRYYAENEPSSPVPLLLARVKRLVTMDFMDILKDLTPDGVEQFRVISGMKEETEEEE